MEFFVSDLSTPLTVGERAPEFSLADARGNKISLSDYAGKNVVVYFYPKAATPGCTTEACDFRDNLNSLRSAGYEVLGISPDQGEALASFAEAESLNFPLLSDPDFAVTTAYGSFGEKESTATSSTARCAARSWLALRATSRWPSTTSPPVATWPGCAKSWASSRPAETTRRAAGADSKRLGPSCRPRRFDDLRISTKSKAAGQLRKLSALRLGPCLDGAHCAIEQCHPKLFPVTLIFASSSQATY